MNNVKTFFKVLKKMEQLESKRMGNVIRNTRIFIFKSNIGYSIYFGISNDLSKDIYETAEDIYETAKSSELEFARENYKKVFLHGTGIFLGTVNEQELNSILFIFNKKYSVNSGHFTSEIAKEKVILFRTNSETSTDASIIISAENAPQAIDEHTKGTKENYFKLIMMNDRDRKEAVKMSEICSSQDYMAILNMLKDRNPKNYLTKAYSLSYLEVMDYAITSGNIFGRSINENDAHGFIPAEEFLRR